MEPGTFAIIKVLLLGCVIAAALVNARNASREDNPSKKLYKTLGVLFSTIPLIGLICYVAARTSAPTFSKACGTQALVGLVWYGLLQALKHAA